MLLAARVDQIIVEKSNLDGALRPGQSERGRRNQAGQPWATPRQRRMNPGEVCVMMRNSGPARARNAAEVVMTIVSRQRKFRLAPCAACQADSEAALAREAHQREGFMDLPQYDELHVVSDLHMGGRPGYQILRGGQAARRIRELGRQPTSGGAASRSCSTATSSTRSPKTSAATSRSRTQSRCCSGSSTTTTFLLGLGRALAEFVTEAEPHAHPRHRQPRRRARLPRRSSVPSSSGLRRMI